MNDTQTIYLFLGFLAVYHPLVVLVDIQLTTISKRMYHPAGFLLATIFAVPMAVGSTLVVKTIVEAVK